MTFYLFDTENPGGRNFIDVLRHAEPEDELILFCTEHTPVSIWCAAPEDVENICRHSCKIRVYDCYAGEPQKSGLDFQIVAELGLLAAKNPFSKFVILSADTGFDVCADYLSKKGYSVSRFDASSEIVPVPGLSKEAVEKIESIRRDLFQAELPASYAEFIFKAYNSKDGTVTPQEMLFKFIGTHETTEFMQRVPKDIRKTYRII
ncbi:PIN domain-containing protein [uncultured Dialister sp.]|uniref:PIN domain-containing protein n=1 Tax=uncultured Dialister sp. TaxID=278064 RepID=UPI0025D6D82A|nr:PIN domain-containing protein [uncultured Dialister sp.]